MLEPGLTPGTIIAPDTTAFLGPYKIMHESESGYWVSYGVHFEHEGILNKSYWDKWSVVKPPKPRRCLNPA